MGVCLCVPVMDFGPVQGVLHLSHSDLCDPVKKEMKAGKGNGWMFGYPLILPGQRLFPVSLNFLLYK